MSSPEQRRQGRAITLKTKLVVAFLLVGGLPLLVLGWVSYRNAESALVDAGGYRLQDSAAAKGEMIDRNLFERFGDVQAFAANRRALSPGAAQQDLIDFLTVNYGVYDLVMVLDAQGIVRAVNSVDHTGAAIESSGLVGRDLSGEEWFQVARSGEAPGGTHYTDAEFSPLVAEVYGEQRLGLPFSAPILDASGSALGVWHNVASFDRIVGDFMTDELAVMRERGFESADARVIRSDGVALFDNRTVGDLSNRLDGYGPETLEAATGSPGSAGFLIEADESGRELLRGYAVTDGALGFAGYDWGVVVGEDVAEVKAGVRAEIAEIIIVGLLGLGFMAAVGWWLARSLSRPLQNAATQLSEVAAGDLRVSLEVRSQDEVGQMSSAINLALQSIRRTLQRVEHAAADLTGSSEELTVLSSRMASSAADTSQEASSVASSTEEVSVTAESVARAMEQMDVSVREISDSTAEAARVSSRAVEVTQATWQRMQHLETSASDIGEVVSVINSIAEQTDLLALNATIEAARVGEAGKGFAVVANEVKALAAQTSLATDQIGNRVEAIQREALAAVQAISEISELIASVSEASTTIAGAVEEQSATTAEVAKSLASMSQGSATISAGIASVAAAADVANTGADETRTSASHLAELAHQLSQDLAGFTLGSDEPEAGTGSAPGPPSASRPGPGPEPAAGSATGMESAVAEPPDPVDGPIRSDSPPAAHPAISPAGTTSPVSSRFPAPEAGPAIGRPVTDEMTGSADPTAGTPAGPPAGHRAAAVDGTAPAAANPPVDRPGVGDENGSAGRLEELDELLNAGWR